MISLQFKYPPSLKGMPDAVDDIIVSTIKDNLDKFQEFKVTDVYVGRCNN